MTELSERPLGLVIIQLDGVSAPQLQRAMDSGWMPELASWVRAGSHRLVAWECALPSQTSASQAGFLYGSTDEVPGFRWYEKDRGRLFVSNHPADAARLEARLEEATETGLLGPQGSSIANLLSGDAARTALTLSSLGRGLERSDDFGRYLANPTTFWPLLVATLREVFVEIGQGWRQRLRQELPRVGRGGSFPFLRAASNVVLRDLAAHLLRRDMQRGVPLAFTTFVGYDVVAHHAGPGRRDALRVLRELDATVARLAQRARTAPRDYRFVLLSDHGQSLGRTFRQRFGHPLEELVQELAQTESVQAPKGRGEGWGYLNALLSEAVQSQRGPARAARRLLAPRRRGPYVEVGPDRIRRRREDARIVVCASGSLGLIYLADWPERLDVETIADLFPGLVGGLAAHEGVSFVLVRSATQGPLVLGSGGIHRLDDGWVEGVDPLAPFGPLAAEQVRRLDACHHVADIVVNGAWDPATGEVNAFEELVGSHGGLGGEQTQAFLLFPAAGAPDTTGAPDTDGLLGADAVHRLLRQWRDEIPALDENAPRGVTG